MHSKTHFARTHWEETLQQSRDPSSQRQRTGFKEGGTKGRGWERTKGKKEKSIVYSRPFWFDFVMGPALDVWYSCTAYIHRCKYIILLSPYFFVYKSTPLRRPEVIPSVVPNRTFLWVWQPWLFGGFRVKTALPYVLLRRLWRPLELYMCVCAHLTRRRCVPLLLAWPWRLAPIAPSLCIILSILWAEAGAFISRISHAERAPQVCLLVTLGE